MDAKCSSHLIILNFITLVIFSEGQIVVLTSMQFSAATCCFLSLKSRYFAQFFIYLFFFTYFNLYDTGNCLQKQFLKNQSGIL